MYSFPNFEPVHCSMSGSNCCFLTNIQVFQRQVRWSVIPISKNFSVCCDPHKGFNMVDEAGRCFSRIPLLYNSTNVGNLISGSSAFSLPSWYLWKFSVHVLLKPSLKDFEHNLMSMKNECSCPVVWTFFAIALLWDWNENWHFSILCTLLGFPNLLAYWVQHFNNIIF